MQSRGEGLTIQDSSHDDLPQGFRIVSVDGVSILDMSQVEVRKCFPVSPADCAITICLESDLMGMNESNPVVRIPMWKEAKRVPSRSTTPLNMQQQVLPSFQQRNQTTLMFCPQSNDAAAGVRGCDNCPASSNSPLQLYHFAIVSSFSFCARFPLSPD